MQILKPQQAVFLKNGYQLGREPLLGLTAVVGWYLDQPNRFLHESVLWKALKDYCPNEAIFSHGMYKSRAEFLVAGALVLDGYRAAGKKSIELTAEMAKTRRQIGVRIPAIEGENLYLLDHIERNADSVNQITYRTESDKRQRNRDSAFGFGPIGASHPLRQDLFNRSTQIKTDFYQENIYPGMPEDLDPRYFQSAHSDQWSDKSFWAPGSSFSLQGFSVDDLGRLQAISGTLPAIAVDMAVWRDARDLAGMEVLPTECSTVWMFPNENIGASVFHVDLPLLHKDEEPLEQVMVRVRTDRAKVIDDELTARAQERTQDPARMLYALLDDQLMPDQSQLELVLEAADHPENIRANTDPKTKQPHIIAREFYRDVRQQISEKQSVAAAAATGHSMKKAVEEELVPIMAKLEGLSPKAKREIDSITTKGETYTGEINKKTLDLSDSTRISDCEFNNFTWIAGIKNVIFENCKFLEGEFRAEKLAGCRFVKCSFTNNKVSETVLERPAFDECTFLNLSFHQCQVDAAMFDNCSGEDIVIDGCVVAGLTLMDGRIKNLKISQSKVENLMTEGAHCVGFGVTASELQAWVIMNSTIDDMQWNRVQGVSVSMHESRITSWSVQTSEIDSVFLGDSSSIGLNMDWTTARQWMFADSRIENGVFQHCILDGANYSGSAFTKSRFDTCSLMASNWYNTNSFETSLKNCLVQNSDFAMLYRDRKCRWDNLTDDGVRWTPRRDKLEAVL